MERIFNLDNLVGIRINNYKKVSKKDIDFIPNRDKSPNYKEERENGIYIKPHVTLSFFANETKKFYFDSFEDAKKFAEKIKNRVGRWI